MICCDPISIGGSWYVVLLSIYNLQLILNSEQVRSIAEAPYAFSSELYMSFSDTLGYMWRQSQSVQVSAHVGVFE